MFSSNVCYYGDKELFLCLLHLPSLVCPTEKQALWMLEGEYGQGNEDWTPSAPVGLTILFLEQALPLSSSNSRKKQKQPFSPPFFRSKSFLYLACNLETSELCTKRKVLCFQEIQQWAEVSILWAALAHFRHLLRQSGLKALRFSWQQTGIIWLLWE